jgi:NADPH:quinone reductase-like Zn-dependent oxidoreductase
MIHDRPAHEECGVKTLHRISEPHRVVTRLSATTVIDHAAQRFEDRVADVDMVVGLVGGQAQTRSWTVLRPGGTLLDIAAPRHQRTLKRHGARGVFFVVTPNRDQLSELARLVDDQRLCPIVDRVVALEHPRIAYRALEHQHPRGKIVISVFPR